MSEDRGPAISSDLPKAYLTVRATTERLAAPLSAEDQTVQSMADVSPTKWHRAHVTWFFETFVLSPHVPDYRLYDDAFAYIFNSYYEALGDRHPRTQRGLIGRPGIAEVARYREFVDEAMGGLLHGELATGVGELITLGLHHEQQHQELLLMDIKNVFSRNPLRPAYMPSERGDPSECVAPPPAGWLDHQGGVAEIGHSGKGFGFDNEFPRHRAYLSPFSLADRPVTCGEWMAFMQDGGYRRPEFWLSDGWAVVLANDWQAPLYWFRDNDEPDRWKQFTLSGVRAVDPNEPVCHVSYYEADAYAHWTGKRLPTEEEWEAVASVSATGDNFLGFETPHPRPAVATNALLGDVWEWTSSAYTPYPGFRAAPGAVGEYNGKFMVSQYVLRGGCCATPPGHARTTYRNFFPPGGTLGLQRCPAGAGSLTRMAFTIDVHLSADQVRQRMRADAIAGLTATPKSIPPVWFYDERGSQLFDQITRLPEYYPTRAERRLLELHSLTIAQLSKADTLVELGAGSCEKTRVLLNALQEVGSLERYVPFDVSDEFLRDAASTLSGEYEGLAIHLVIGDFSEHLAEIPTDGRRLIAFLGGTIGNLDPARRAWFLFDLNCTMSSDDSLLLGADLVKDRHRLVTAYDDAAGVTAEFNKNVLLVLNRQFGGNFDPAIFSHVALWNEDEQWIEMRLRADQACDVTLRETGMTVHFAQGEELLTEISAKFTPERIENELQAAGFVVDGMWGAEEGEFLLTLAHPFC